MLVYITEYINITTRSLNSLRFLSSLQNVQLLLSREGIFKFFEYSLTEALWLNIPGMIYEKCIHLFDINMMMTAFNKCLYTLQSVKVASPI